MASTEMNQDMVLEILSHFPVSFVQKFRVLNKECNKRTYGSSFLNANLQRTKAVSGYFLQYRVRSKCRSAFFEEGEVSDNHEAQVSLDFLLPGSITMEACDPSHGIVLCVDECPVRGRGPLYIVCKPTTKQYVIIPKPKTRYFTIALGLMVTGSDPLQYKILRLSQLPSREMNKYNFRCTLVCEVFDSHSFLWKRLDNVILPDEDVFLSKSSKPVACYGFLHWLLNNNNVFRFCFKTETWSIIPVPENLANRRCVKLASYEGKLGVISARSKDYQEIWVLERCFGNSWINVAEIKTGGLEPVGFSSNDVITLADENQICLYNMNNGKSQNIQTRTPYFCPFYCFHTNYFPFRSDYKRVEFRGRSNRDNPLLG